MSSNRRHFRPIANDILRRAVTVTTILAVVTALTSIAGSGEKPKGGDQNKKNLAWQSLFDGKTLGKWKSTEFGGEGDVLVKNGELVLEFGNDMTGVTWQDPKSLPRSNYEIELEAKRVDGSDFFCGMTFPVKKEPCSLILGGWGGGVCGLSSINGMDASENETTTYEGFKNGQWYKVRLRVTDGKIEAWLDKKKIINQAVKDRKFSVRLEVELSQPLGFATWQTSAALRKIRLRKLSAAEVKKSIAEAASDDE